MRGAEELSPVGFAALVAPAISRVFVAGMQPDEDDRRVVRDHGGANVGLMIDLRNPLAAGRVITRRNLADLYRYTDPGDVDAAMARSVEHGLLKLDSDGYRPTRSGQAFLDDLFAAQGRKLSSRWGSAPLVVSRLNVFLATLIEAAMRSGGPALQIQAPPYEPHGTPPELVLFNRLATLRYHRTDAHAEAWRAAGMTAAEVVAQPWGTEWTQQRIAVERRTNELAGAPFGVLEPGDRLRLLADLAALP